MAKDVLFFDPKTQSEVKRKRAMAQKLMEYGKQPESTEMISGIAIKRSPLEAMAKALSTGVAGYAEGRADELETQDTEKRQKKMAEAVAMYQQDPQGAARMLMESPATAELGLKLGIPALSSGSNSLPAPMQIANEMYQLEQAMNNPNATAKERYEAQRQYNLLGQTAKTYGFDRGTEVTPNMYPPTNPTSNMPPMPEPAPDNLPPAPTDLQPKPQPTANQLPAGQFQIPNNQDLGYIDIPAKPNISSIAGYDQTIANREALKASAVEEAKKVSGAMPAPIVKEQNEIVDKINTAQSLESNMNKFATQIDTGELDLGMMANLENMARNKVGMSTEQSRNLGSFKANLERMRNESLRLNNGVQTEGDAIRAWNELVNSINDPEFVKQRVKEIAEINRKGSLLQNQKLNLMRSEYGRGGLNIPNINAPKPDGAKANGQIKFLGFE